MCTTYYQGCADTGKAPTFPLKHRKKKVYVCGLDGDFKRKKFGEILDLIPICDKVYKLQSLCALCKNGEKGIFSLRVTEDTGQTLVGVENYKPVCRNCYIKNNT